MQNFDLKSVDGFLLATCRNSARLLINVLHDKYGNDFYLSELYDILDKYHSTILDEESLRILEDR